MPTVAIVGAGPGLGLSIAKAFGGHGFDVALISRTKEKLDGLVEELTATGITADGFPADVADPRQERVAAASGAPVASRADRVVSTGLGPSRSDAAASMRRRAVIRAEACDQRGAGNGCIGWCARGG
ncbi:SDR family NAD(P)-dependent oxidoreductase [Streptomyces sp. BE133]|uniref:SDR family NAD(P)-dependent oxidoreductase n=1 Tax=Streptomyces sp. BE133 TaxID=3002523 RepID=UPI003FA73F92